MRVKNVLAAIPLVPGLCANLKLFWSRVTATRLTTIYFVFSVINCIVQALLQGEATVINAKAADYLYGIVTSGNATAEGFYVWSNDELRYCDYVPDHVDASGCTLVWRPGQASSMSQSENSNGTLNMSAFSSSMLSATMTASSGLATPSSSPVRPISSAAPLISSSSTAALSSSSSIAPSSSSSASSALVSSTATSTITSAAALASQTVLVVEEADDDSDDESDAGSESESDSDDDEAVLVVSPSRRREIDRRHGAVTVLEINLNGSVDVVLDGWGYTNTPVTLTQKCVDALNWPAQELDNTKREDIAFTAFQFWVLGMSLVALLNESIPHIIASLVTHLSSVAWGAFQLSQTQLFHDDYHKVITAGVCQVNFLPTYWKARSNVEIPSLALNAAGLLMSMFLSYKLIKMFGWQTFKRVGASRTIKRVYQLVLVLSVTIQLSLFFVVASVALWLDQICNGAIGRLAKEHKTYEVLLYIVLVLLPIWLVGGWFAVRREMKILMTVFLVLSGAYIVGWGVMFDSMTFRWTFSQWSFFAVVMSLGVALVIVCFVVGIFCRINFNRGLTHYLSAEEPLPGDDFERVTGEKMDGSDPEKFEFPSSSGPLPTFEAAYGYDDEAPPPPGSRTLGPRFYMQQNGALDVENDQVSGPAVYSPNLSNMDFDPRQNPTSRFSFSQASSATRAPSPTYSREGSETTVTAHAGLPKSVRPTVRQGSIGSQKSFASSRSAASTKTAGSTKSETMKPRWVIE
ncbi:hypothetical protein PENSPDRAFT_681658 [Peniophora sp. CONT]|nr:hypothetical protein PENSPDRAFT_681658 [Peniophora sp. CONT]